MFKFLLCLFLIIGSTSEPIVQVDLIELNHYHETKPNGSINFGYDQYIMYLYDPSYRRHDVHLWVLKKDVESFNKTNGIYKLVYYNMELKKNIIIRSKMFRETNTLDIDPERENKKLFDEKLRMIIK